MSLLKDILTSKRHKARSERFLKEEKEDSSMESADLIRRFEDCRDHILNRLSEVQRLVQDLPKDLKADAEKYWMPHMFVALSGDQDWAVSKDHISMAKTIQDLKDFQNQQ